MGLREQAERARAQFNGTIFDDILEARTWVASRFFELEAAALASDRERDRYRAAFEKCAEALGLDTNNESLEGSLTMRVLAGAREHTRALAQTNAELDALLEGRTSGNSTRRLDRLRWLLDAWEKQIEERAAEYTAEVKAKREAQQALKKVAAVVDGYRVERDQAQLHLTGAREKLRVAEQLAAADARAHTRRRQVAVIGLIGRLERLEAFVAGRCHHDVSGMLCGARRVRDRNGCEAHVTGPVRE